MTMRIRVSKLRKIIREEIRRSHQSQKSHAWKKEGTCTRYRERSRVTYEEDAIDDESPG